MNSLKKSGLALIICLVVSVSASAQDIIGGNSIGILAPSATLGDAYVVGLNFNGHMEWLVTDNFRPGLEIGVQSWSPQDDFSDAEENTTYSIGAGAKYFLGPFFVGSDAVYFLGDFNEFSVLPNTGFRFGKFNLEITYSALDPVKYIGFELGYIWASN